MDIEVTSAESLLGIDVDWFARDRVGHVACFSTGGNGYVPEAMWRDAAAQLHASVAFDSGAVPVTTTGRRPPGIGDETWALWAAAAKSGFYHYDADLGGGSYSLMAFPDTPLVVTDLPSVVARAVERVHYRSFRFAGLWRIEEEWLANP